MNKEIIKNLADDCYSADGEFDTIKFADTIITKCIVLCHSNTQSHKSPLNNHNLAVFDCAMTISQHFGYDEAE